ncbi:MAG: hypothetical protein AAGE59_19730 [Cyanobacteria bacterium P01_F01_bin.86]
MVNLKLKRYHFYSLLAFSTLSTVLALATPSHALILDPARDAMSADLTAAGWDEGSGMNLLFGLVELILVALPIIGAVGALTQINRGAEGWMPWIGMMGASVVLIGFVTFMVNAVYA